MVAVFNKELISWYLITLKLKETVAASLPPPTTNPTTTVIDRAPPPPDSEWVISIRDKLDRARQDELAGSWSKLSIYRVPKSLREGHDDKAYVPQSVSVGPYHHNKRRLRDMDRHKWRSLHQVLKRTGHDIKLYLDAMRSVEDRARDCYEGGALGMGGEEFAEMLVLDGCFVLELFRGAAAEGFKELGYSRNDPVFAVRGTMHSIQRDMIMLENQLPLFVLDLLLGLQIGDPDQTGLVARLALRFFDPLTPSDEPIKMMKPDDRSSRHNLGSIGAFDPLCDQGGLHCLDVFRRSLLVTGGPRPAPRKWIKRWSHGARVADKRRQQLIHCVTELRDAGIKFEKRRTDRFWDIRFENGVLMIPRILIHDGTKSLFLNLIAFEQCHVDCSNDITSYVIFMDNLINSEDDVRYLHHKGIIEHWLGSDDEVADLFNRLCQEVVFDINDSYLSRLSEQVNSYYNHRWNAWRASLKHNYFNSPWSIISFVAAVILLLLTLAQTYYSIYAFYRPSS